MMVQQSQGSYRGDSAHCRRFALPVKMMLRDAKQAPVAETVMVVPCTEQPVLVWVQEVVYDAHEELETLLTQLTVQSEAVLLAVQVGLELEIELAVVVSPDVGCVEDLFVLVGALEGESSGGGPSTLGGDVQSPTGIPKILIHGR